MKNISSFLEKFSKLIKTDDNLKNNIISSIKNITGFEIKKENISIKNKIAYIKEKPHFKNEVFMNKDKILNELFKINNTKEISDIR